MGLPESFYTENLDGGFDYIHLFVTQKTMLEKEFDRMKAHLHPQGTLWVSWPKAKQLGTDLDLTEVIRIGYDHVLVESTCMSINDIWSALKFTFPKPGKEYHNSYGKHPKTYNKNEF
ncbi:hypothetical protein C4F40_17380 [Sphingobacterium sp. Ka21]|uniref:DUF3052 domain-containing protein n=2 Tax=Sphingobacterium pedocola TaxID=2082722 RepID=A0ABR9TB01_9SPHI|nr:hypothetical protein [Sphingobacterium pedocola]